MLPHEILDFSRLIRNQWLPASELRDLQERKLRRLVSHAYERVPYYRRLFDSAKLKPEDIRGLPDLAKVPMTTRAQILEHPLKDVTARGIDLRRCRIQTTSGTTGVPFKTYYRRKDLTRINLGWARTYLAHGMKARDRIAAFQGWRNAERKKAWYEFLGIWRRRTLSSLDGPEAWASELQKWEPQVIMGYSMTLKLLAAAVRERRADRIRPRMIFHTSGLLHERDREFIDQAFGSKVIDIYGSDEGGCIAWECPRCRGYHVNVDLIVLEIRRGRPGRAAGNPGRGRDHEPPFLRHAFDPLSPRGYRGLEPGGSVLRTGHASPEGHPGQDR